MFKQTLTFSLSLCLHTATPFKGLKENVKKEKAKKKSLSLINHHEEDHPSCHCYTIGAPAPATAPLSSPGCFCLCVRERKSGALSPVIPLKKLDRLTRVHSFMTV